MRHPPLVWTLRRTEPNPLATSSGRCHLAGADRGAPVAGTASLVGSHLAGDDWGLAGSHPGALHVEVVSSW